MLDYPWKSKYDLSLYDTPPARWCRRRVVTPAPAGQTSRANTSLYFPSESTSNVQGAMQCLCEVWTIREQRREFKVWMGNVQKLYCLQLVGKSEERTPYIYLGGCFSGNNAKAVVVSSIDSVVNSSAADAVKVKNINLKYFETNILIKCNAIQQYIALVF